ncbi:MAG TPA: DUF4157 domain-containing protein, partial [Allosphingosinicella sp.]|nr:DUF4157 domain-containing protein [Allosphingosinicella sp.]
VPEWDSLKSAAVDRAKARHALSHRFSPGPALLALYLCPSGEEDETGLDRQWAVRGREHPMRSLEPPRSRAADRKSADRPRGPVPGPRPAQALRHFSGGAGASREGPAPRAAGALPEGLQTVMEAMSGFSLADVVVHRNSAEPARLGAAAFTRGNEIHLASRQEGHLPHEAWHVVQQKQGRVAATFRVGGFPVNDDSGLEREADAATRLLQSPAAPRPLKSARTGAAAPIQRVLIYGTDVKPDAAGKNLKLFDASLDAIISAQDDDVANNPACLLAKVTVINQKLEVDVAAFGQPSAATLKDIETFYNGVNTLNFNVNPILRETWRRCVDATKDWKTYSKVGGKFLSKYEDVLSEIKADFPSLEPKAKKVVTFKVNKEHMVNKGGAHQGAQTASVNLMHAGVPASGSAASLSEPHKGLHAMKSGTGQVSYTALDPNVRKIIETAQKSAAYQPTAMGSFH